MYLAERIVDRVERTVFIFFQHGHGLLSVGRLKQVAAILMTSTPMRGSLTRQGPLRGVKHRASGRDRVLPLDT